MINVGTVKTFCVPKVLSMVLINNKNMNHSPFTSQNRKWNLQNVLAELCHFENIFLFLESKGFHFSELNRTHLCLEVFYLLAPIYTRVRFSELGPAFSGPPRRRQEVLDPMPLNRGPV